MFQRDYIMRMLTSFTAVVAQLMGLKRDMKHEQVFVVVNETLEKYFRLNSKMIQSLSDRDLLNLLKVNEELDNEKAIVVAYLLKAEGESYEAIGSVNESYKRYLMALTLYLAAVQNDAYVDVINFHSEIDDLIDKLQIYELPNHYKLQLFDYYNKVDSYDAAEDILFELIEGDLTSGNPDSFQTTQKGLLFYNRLLQKEDFELLAGGLPRNEVIEGLEQLKQKVIKTE